MTELTGQLADPGRYLRAQRDLGDVSRNTLAAVLGSLALLAVMAGFRAAGLRPSGSLGRGSAVPAPSR